MIGSTFQESKGGGGKNRAGQKSTKKTQGIVSSVLILLHPKTRQYIIIKVLR